MRRVHLVHATPEPRATTEGFVVAREPGPGIPAARACGALGRFDPERVERMAALLGDVRMAHRDRRSALWLDREPIRWAGNGVRGLAWSESPRPPGSARSWAEAASALDACGVVLRGRRRLVHSSASGLAPVYWMDNGRATYFCSRLDPLVATAPKRLRPDWAAWAAIIRIGYAVGSRTPFEEIRRLEHSSTLERGPAGGVVTVGRWPWAEIEPATPEQALDETVEALRRELGALAGGEIVMGLSGGADSRLLLAGLLDRGAEVRAFTLPGAWGRDDDHRLARQVASAADVPHELLPPATGGYWADAGAFAEASEYQQALEWAWFAPLVRRLAAERGLAVDGLAGDILVHGKYASAEVVAAGGSAEATGELLWARLRRARSGRRLLARRMERAITAVAREEVKASCARLDGHPAAFTLAHYRLRTTRGMSAGVRALSGAVPTAAPFVADAVARAAMRCSPQDKVGGAFHGALLARLAPQLAAIPNNSFGGAPPGERVHNRRREDAALEGFLDLLAESPFRRWFRGPLRDAVDSGNPGGLTSLGQARVINGYALHALWLRRYGDRLRGASPRALLG